MLDILQDTEYALALAPGFFKFYLQMGVLHGLEAYSASSKCDVFKVTQCSGASAGALISGFLAAGMKPHSMVKPVLSITRNDVWDVTYGFGLLKGSLFHSILVKELPCQTFEECHIPLGMTAYNLFGCKTNIITKGDLASSIRASCCFPILFQPVWIDSTPHIDGGVFDHCGLMALPGIPDSSKLIVNIINGDILLASSTIPSKFNQDKDVRLLTIVLDNFPFVTPFNMSILGPVAYKSGKKMILKALHGNHMCELYGENHWITRIDGSSYKTDDDDDDCDDIAASAEICINNVNK